MDLDLEEMRIRALFHELRREDIANTTPFFREWSRAQSRAAHSGRRFGYLKVAAVSVVLCLAVLAIATVLLLSQEQAPNVRKQIVTSSTTERQVLTKSETVVQEVMAGTRPKILKRSTARRHRWPHGKPEAKLVSTSQNQGSELSRWRSPTALLLSSAADRLLRSFPRVDQSSQEFKSFMPERLN